MTSPFTKKCHLEFENAVAKKVSALNFAKKEKQKNERLICNQIQVLANLHGLSENEVRAIYKDELFLKKQKKTLQKELFSDAKILLKSGSSFLIFLAILFMLMFSIGAYNMGFL